MNNISSKSLLSMHGCNFQIYLNSKELRKKIIMTVMQELVIPLGWRCEGVFGDEDNEGGDHTSVLCRFMPPHNTFHIMLCCPYESSETWLLVYLSREEDEVLLLRQSEAFNPELLNHSLELTALLDSKGLLVNEIKNTLSFEADF